MGTVSVPDVCDDGGAFRKRKFSFLQYWNLLTRVNTGEFVGHAPTGRSFRIKAVSVYEHNAELFTRETVYYDSASLFGQLGLPVGNA